MDIRAIIALVLSILSAVFGILALSLPYWNKIWVFHTGLWTGLWTRCVELRPSDVICSGIPWNSTDSKMKTVRSLLIISTFIGISAVINLSIKQFIKKEARLLKPISAVFCLVAGTLYLISSIIYGTDDVYNRKLYVAFYLDIVAGILGLAAGIAIFFIKND